MKFLLYPYVIIFHALPIVFSALVVGVILKKALPAYIMSLIRLPGDQLSSPSLIGLSKRGMALKAFSSVFKSKVAVKLLWGVSSASDLLEMLKEVMIMTSLQHLCLISLKYLVCVGPHTYAIVTDLMDMSLKGLIDNGRSYSQEHIQLIIYQVVLALRHVNAAGVAHTAVGLCTVLMNATCDVKLCGFQGCTQHDTLLRECKWVTRVLPPEQCSQASEKLDVYQTGLLFLSLLLRQDVTRRISPTSLCAYLATLPALERDLAEQFLAPDPCARISFQAALSHPYFAALDLEPEESTPTPINLNRLEKLNEQELERELALELSN